MSHGKHQKEEGVVYADKGAPFTRKRKPLKPGEVHDKTKKARFFDRSSTRCLEKVQGEGGNTPMS